MCKYTASRAACSKIKQRHHDDDTIQSCDTLAFVLVVNRFTQIFRLVSVRVLFGSAPSSVPSDSFVRSFRHDCVSAHTTDSHTYRMCGRLRRPYGRHFVLPSLVFIGSPLRSCCSFVCVYPSPSVDERARSFNGRVCLFLLRRLHSFSFRMRHHQSEARPFRHCCCMRLLLSISNGACHVGGVVLVLCGCLGRMCMKCTYIRTRKYIPAWCR